MNWKVLITHCLLTLIFFSLKKEDPVENTPVIPDSFEFNEPATQRSIDLNPEEWKLEKNYPTN